MPLTTDLTKVTNGINAIVSYQLGIALHENDTGSFVLGFHPTKFAKVPDGWEFIRAPTGGDNFAIKQNTTEKFMSTKVVPNGGSPVVTSSNSTFYWALKPREGGAGGISISPVEDDTQCIQFPVTDGKVPDNGTWVTVDNCKTPSQPGHDNKGFILLNVTNPQGGLSI